MSNDSRSILSINCLQFSEININDVDYIISACGYESRCIFVSKNLLNNYGDKEKLSKKSIVFRFTTVLDSPGRKLADAYYDELNPYLSIPINTDDWEIVFTTINNLLLELGKINPVILIDYSSMSRVQYLCLLRFVEMGCKLIFTYSIGLYDSIGIEFPISTVGTIGVVPGFEGIPFQGFPKQYVFGLGYDGVGALALADRLEVQEPVCFWTDPGAEKNTGEIIQRANKSIISKSIIQFSRDLRDVVGTYIYLNRICLDSKTTEKVIFVPIGPKPQILACGLASWRYTHSTVLAPHLEGGGITSDYPNIKPNGEIIVTQVNAA